MTIPKRILYFWHGENEPQEYVGKWPSVAKGFSIERINEGPEAGEPEFVKIARDRRLWAFVSDYYRLKALYEMGGVYLDTDVRLWHEFSDEMMSSGIFMGFINDASMGTAVIGASAHQLFMRDLLRLYDGLSFCSEGNHFFHEDYSGVEFANNNDLITFYLIVHSNEFILDGRRQSIRCCGSSLEIYPKEEFEMGDIFRRCTATHECWGSWHGGRGLESSVKRAIGSLGPIDLRSVKRHLKNRQRSSEMPFYEASKVRNLYSDFRR